MKEQKFKYEVSWFVLLLNLSIGLVLVVVFLHAEISDNYFSLSFEESDIFETFLLLFVFIFMSIFYILLLIRFIRKFIFTNYLIVTSKNICFPKTFCKGYNECCFTDIEEIRFKKMEIFIQYAEIKTYSKKFRLNSINFKEIAEYDAVLKLLEEGLINAN